MLKYQKTVPTCNLSKDICMLIDEFAVTYIMWYQDTHGRRQEGVYIVDSPEEYTNFDIELMIYLDAVNSRCVYRNFTHVNNFTDYTINQVITFKEITYYVFSIDYLYRIVLYNLTRGCRIDPNYKKYWYGANFLKKNHMHMMHNDVLDYLKDSNYASLLKKNKHQIINDLQHNNGFMHMITADDPVPNNRSKYKLGKLEL